MKRTFIFMSAILTLILLIVSISAVELNPFGDTKIIEQKITPAQIDSNDFMKAEVSDYPTIQISKTLFWIPTDKVAEYKITKNEPCLIDCKTEGKAVLYSEGKLFSDAKFKDMYGDNKNINYKYYIEVTETKKEEVNDYKQECKERTNFSIDNTDNLCNNVLAGTHTEENNYTYWKEYNFETLPSGNYKWKVEGKKDIKSNIDMIPVANDKEFTEWAWWNNTWNYKRNVTINAQNGTYFPSNYTIFVNVTNMTNLDCASVRWINGTETTELPYYLDSNASNYCYFAVYISTLANQTIYMYYNTTSPVSTTSNLNTAFMYGDDFSTNTASKYQSANCDNFAVSGGVMVINSTGSTWCAVGPNVTYQFLSNTYAVESKFTSILGTDRYFNIFGYSSSPTNYGTNGYASQLSASQNLWLASGADGPLQSIATSINMTKGYFIYLRYLANGNSKWAYANNVTLSYQTTPAVTTTTRGTSGNYGMGQYSGTGGMAISTRVYYFRVYPYVFPEPTYVIGSTSNAPPINSSLQVTLSSPSDNAVSLNPTINFTSSIIDNTNLSNATLNVTSINNSVTYINTTIFPNGLSNYTLGVPLTILDGIYKWFVTVYDVSSNSVMSTNFTVTVDTSNLQISNNVTTPAGPVEFLLNNAYYFNITINNSNGTAYLTLNGTSYPANNVSNNYYVNLTNLSAGNYVYNWSAYSSGVAHYLNTSSNYNYLIYAPVYPNFSAFSVSPANGSNYVAGTTTSFNAFIKPTNGTVVLTFNNTKYLASSVLFNAFQLITDIVPGTYIYNWTSYGNGTYHYENHTQNFFYTVLSPISFTLSPTNATTSFYKYNLLTCTVNSSTYLNNLTLMANNIPVYTIYNTTANQTSLTLNYNYSTNPPNNIYWNCSVNYANNLIQASQTNVLYQVVDIPHFLDTNFSDYVTNSFQFLLGVEYDSSNYQILNPVLCTNLINISNIACIPFNILDNSDPNNLLYQLTLDLPNTPTSFGTYIYYYDYQIYDPITDSIQDEFSDLRSVALTDINFGECNSSITTKTMNITTWDEQTLNRINPFDFKATINYFIGNGTTFKTTTFNNLSVAEMDLCIDTNITYNLTGQIQYSANLYSPTYYEFINHPINNTVQNISLYLLNISSSTQFLLFVKSQNTQFALPGYYIFIYRYIPNSNTPILVQSSQTDNNGQAVANFEINKVYYAFIITDPMGDIVYTSGKEFIVPQTSPYSITFYVGTPIPSPYSYFANTTGLTHSLTFNSNTLLTTYLWTDSNSTFSSAYMKILGLNNSGTDIVICNITSTDNPGVVTCNLTGNMSGSYSAQAYIVRGGISYLVDQLTFDIQGFQSGYLGLLGAFFILMICGFAFAFSINAGIISLNAGIIFCQLLGLMRVGIIGISAFVGVSILIMIVIDRG